LRKLFRCSVLVATDVMARGLDIPKIDHVVHYQIPPTAELYVHRSGRTARAQATGLSLCIIDPADKKNWNTITFTLKKESVKEFPVDLAFYTAVKVRVETARKLDRLLHHQQKDRHSKSWLNKTANQLDLDAAEVDDGPVDDAAVKQAAVDRKRMQNEIARLRSELQWHLSRPLVPEGTSSKYYTKNTFLALKDTRVHSAQADLKQKGKVSSEDKKRLKQRQDDEEKAVAKPDTAAKK
jgi:ATP-dependent RNA helicase DDX24/MAK5